MSFKRIFNRKIVVSLCIIAYMASISIAGLGTSIATDKTGDVGKVTFANNLTASYSTNVPGHPEIDIVSADYTKDANGNVTVTITMAAAPVIDSNHWYVANLGIDSDITPKGFIGLMTAGSVLGANFTDSEAGSVNLIDDSDDVNTFLNVETIPLSNLVSGNSLVFNFGTKSVFGPDYVYPANPSDKGWLITVTTIYSTSLATYTVSGGDIFTDYYPDSDNLYDTNAATTAGNGGAGASTTPAGSNAGTSSGTGNGGTKSSPGFEVYIVLLSSIVALVYKKRRN